ncbi:MAG TPA: ATP-binding protein [Kineosporiaceae bacterium]|nr:ATP-binding protein [Kineosporiaceae bacterium]
MRGVLPEAGRRMGLATRLLTAQMLVVVTGVLTAWLVAAAIAPALFRMHMREAGPSVTHEATMHAEEAFQSASAVSLTVALLAALGASVAVSAYLARRLSRSLRPLSQAAAQVANGHYDVRVQPPGLGAEFEELSAAFNHMAGRLDRVEETRRRLLSDLAHELRTPVATLSAYLEAVEDGVAYLDPETVAVMQAQTARLARLAQDVGAVSRAEEHQFALHLQPITPAAVVSSACAAAADRYAAKGVRLDGDVPADLPPISVDPDRMAQVMGNLLDNALRYTPEGGGVQVLADQDHGHVRLRVTDTGQGISSEHLPHVFERFYRVDAARDRAHGGSGIGLAIVKALVEAHGGRVTASSHGPGTGATFTFTVPARALAHPRRRP